MKMKKSRKMIALAAGAILSMSAALTPVLAETPAPGTETEPPVSETESCGHKGKSSAKQEAEEPENAIGKDAAKEAALKDAGISADAAGKVRARLAQTEDGTVVYKVSFVSNSVRYSYRINAVSGAVVEKSSAEAAAETASKSEKRGMKQEAEEPENAIGKDAAKEAALKDAGISEDAAGKVRARLTTTEDGTVIYKVSFVSNSVRYAYQINAVSGAVVEKNSEAVTDTISSATKTTGKQKSGTSADDASL